MARRLNFTGRRKINRSDVNIRLCNDENGLRFDADLKLGEYDLAPDATVHVEAYRSVSTQWKRFDFGRVGAPRIPENRSLAEFAYPEGILFRVKVASSGDALGRLLAEADKVRPLLPDETNQAVEPIIEPVPADLGETPWQIDLDGDRPQLKINDRIPDWKGVVRQPVFRSLVAPEVMRIILREVLVIDRDVGDEDDDGNWRMRWLRFAENLPGVGESPGPAAEDETSTTEQDEWIEEAVNAFCRQAGLLSRLIAFQEGQ